MFDSNGKLAYGRTITSEGQTKYVPRKLDQLSWDEYIEEIPEKEGNEPQPLFEMIEDDDMLLIKESIITLQVKAQIYDLLSKMKLEIAKHVLEHKCWKDILDRFKQEGTLKVQAIFKEDFVTSKPEMFKTWCKENIIYNENVVSIISG